jgi:hypothetical protein
MKNFTEDQARSGATRPPSARYLLENRISNRTSDDCYNPPVDQAYHSVRHSIHQSASQYHEPDHLEETLKSICTLLLTLLLFVSIGTAQSVPARTDVYHVHFAKAALGKSVELADYLKTADPNVPMSAHRIVLRHQDGEDWDYAVIQHMGTKTTVEAAGTAVPPAMRDLSSWHNDTFVNGPSWAEFSKTMGIDEGSASKTAGSVYVVSVYRAAPGHREQLEKSLSQTPPGDGAPVSVLMQHLEGGPWTYLSVARYKSWQDFATNQTNSVADTFKAGGGWLGLREHSTYHNDTLTDRIAP